MTAAATAQTTVYYDSFVSGFVPIFNGSSWTYFPIPNDEVSMGLDAGVPHVASGSAYDVFAIGKTGSLVIVIGPAWSSTTSRGTGAGTTQLVRQNGLWVNAVALTHAWGGASGTTDYGLVQARTGTYLGTVYATANGQTAMNFIVGASAAGGTNNFLALYNAYNQVGIIAIMTDSNGSYTPTAGVHTLDNSNNTRITYIDGLATISPLMSIAFVSKGGTLIYINQDSNSAAQGSVNFTNNDGTNSGTVSGSEGFLPILGLHFFQAMTNGTGATIPNQGGMTFSGLM